MKPNNTAEKLISIVLVVFLCGYGWFSLLNGEVYIVGRRGEGLATGVWALGIAAFVFLMAAACSLLVAKAFSLSKRVTICLIALILGLPLLVCLFSDRCGF